MNEGVTAGMEDGGEPRFALASYARIVKAPDETIDQTRERALAWLDRRGLPPDDRFVFAAVDEEDEATGKRYVASPGQRFRGADGTEYVISDVRPNQMVIRDTASGDVRTIALRGPRG